MSVLWLDQSQKCGYNTLIYKLNCELLTLYQPLARHQSWQNLIWTGKLLSSHTFDAFLHFKMQNLLLGSTSFQKFICATLKTTHQDLFRLSCNSAAACHVMHFELFEKKIILQSILAFCQQLHLISGCSTVRRAVAYITRGPQFKFSHKLNLPILNIYLLRKEARNGPFCKNCCI